MGDSECEHSVPSESGKLCKWLELRTMCDRFIYSECRYTDELLGMWQWNYDERSG